MYQGRLSTGHSAPGASYPTKGVRPLGVFEFVIVLVLISTVGKVLSDRRAPQELEGGPQRLSRGEADGIREIVDNLSTRMERLEEERDFYKDLLDAPNEPRQIQPPDGREGPAS